MCPGELQKKVQTIALVWIVLHVIGFVGEVFHVSPFNTGNFGRLAQNKEVICIFIESLLGTLTCSLLYVGAKRKNKYLLVPFMLVMVLLQIFLFLTFIMLGYLCFTHRSNTMVEVVGMVVLFLLLLLSSWMLKTTLAFYKEIGRFNVHNRITITENNNNAAMESIVRARRVAGEVVITNDIESNLCVQLPIDTNVYPTTEVPIISPLPRRLPQDEQPPAYTALATTDNGGAELPPSYDEALALKNQNPESIV